MMDFIYAHLSYPILFFWSLLEGETGLVLAGFLSKQGKFDFYYVILIAFCGALISDTLLYLLGRFYQAKANYLLHKYQSQIEKVNKWILHYGGWVVIFDRFIYGTHIPAMLLVGMAKYDFKKFILLEFIGVSFWGLTFTSLGYVFGDDVINIIQLVQHHLLTLILVIVFFFLYRYKRTPKK